MECKEVVFDARTGEQEERIVTIEWVMTDAEAIAKQQVDQRREEIFAELRANDSAIIRALAEGDAERIQAHNAKQALLREELLALRR